MYIMSTIYVYNVYNICIIGLQYMYNWSTICVYNFTCVLGFKAIGRVFDFIELFNRP